MAHADILQIKNDTDRHHKDFQEGFSSYQSQLAYFLDDSKELLLHVHQRAGDSTVPDYVIDSLKSSLDVIQHELIRFDHNADDRESGNYNALHGQYPNLPTSLWANKTRKDTCIKRIADYLYTLKRAIDNDLFGNLQHLINATPALTSCVTDYKVELDQVVRVMKMNQDILQQRKQTVAVQFEKIKDVFVAEIGYIESNISFFKDLHYQYAVMHKTKLSLTSDIGPKIISGISNVMSSLISKVETRAFNPLKQDIEKTKDDIQLLYHNTLEALSGLVGYFEDDRWEQSARNMNIWQGPVAELETSYILRYVLYVTLTSWHNIIIVCVAVVLCVT